MPYRQFKFRFFPWTTKFRMRKRWMGDICPFLDGSDELRCDLNRIHLKNAMKKRKILYKLWTIFTKWQKNKVNLTNNNNVKIIIKKIEKSKKKCVFWIFLPPTTVNLIFLLFNWLEKNLDVASSWDSVTYSALKALKVSDVIFIHVLMKKCQWNRSKKYRTSKDDVIGTYEQMEPQEVAVLCIR